MTLISVIVPLYNYERYIRYCIRSIASQTYDNFELIIVDDHSKDNSYKIAKKNEEKDSRIKVVRLDKNYGYSKAKNEGIILSKGDYIVTLDADDMMIKKSLEIRIKAAIKNNVSFVYADAIMVKNNITLKECYGLNIGKIKKKRTSNAVYDASSGIYNIHAQTIMIHREVFKKYGLFDEKLRARSDREMWWRLFGRDESEKPKISSHYINSPVAYYRYHRNSMWRKRKRNKSLDNMVIKESEKSYKMRKNNGIIKDNTRFLEN